jgi:hypothetical protein
MSKIEVDKIDPQSGTALEVGTSGDTVTVPSGVTLTTTNATVNLPASVGGLGTGITNAQLAGSIDVTSKITGVVPAANLGTGSASSTTVLYGDGTFKTEPGGAWSLLSTTTIASPVAAVELTTIFSANTGYKNFRINANNMSPVDEGANFRIQFYNAAGSAITSSTYTQLGYDAYAEAADAGFSAYAHRDRAYFTVEGSPDATAQYTSGFSVEAYDPHTDGINKWFDITGRVDYNNNATFYGTFCQCLEKSAVTLNGIKIFMSSGNLDAGVIQVYGY